MCVCSNGWMFLFSRILFKDKERNWDEIENKLRSESETPLLKTSNKVERLFHPPVWLYLHLLDGHHFLSFYQEISSILFELKRVEKQLQGKDTLSCFIMNHIKVGRLKKQVLCPMRMDPPSSSSCFCLSDQRDGRSRRNTRCFGQPRPGQPHHSHPAPNQQNRSLRHQRRVRPRSQTVPARDPSWSWRRDTQGPVFSQQRRGHRTWPQRGAGVNGRTVVQSHAAERRGGHCTEVNPFPEVWVGVSGWVNCVNCNSEPCKRFSLTQGLLKHQ